MPWHRHHAINEKAVVWVTGEALTYSLGTMTWRQGMKDDPGMYFRDEWNDHPSNSKMPGLDFSLQRRQCHQKTACFIKGSSVGLVSSEQPTESTTDRGRLQKGPWKLGEMTLSEPWGVETMGSLEFWGCFLIDCHIAFVPCEDRLVFCNGPWWTRSWRRNSSQH